MSKRHKNIERETLFLSKPVIHLIIKLNLSSFKIQKWNQTNPAASQRKYLLCLSLAFFKYGTTQCILNYDKYCPGKKVKEFQCK